MLVSLPCVGKEYKEIQLRAIASLAKFKNHPLIRIVALEYEVSIDPTDADKRFSLAYAYSELDDAAAALMHYLAIPDARRNESTWNNLAVARQELKLPVLAVDAYQIADAKDSSLAMSNLAQAYIKAGFYSEAEAICKKGLELSDPHENLPATFAQIRATRTEEKKIEDAAVIEVEPRSRLMQKFGEGTLGAIKTPLPVLWIGPQGSLKLMHTSDEIVISGQYAQQKNGLIGLFDLNPTPTTFELTIRGTLYGRTVVGTIQRKKLGNSQSIAPLALDLEAPATVIFLFSEDCRSIDVLENPGKNFRQFTLTASDS